MNSHSFHVLTPPQILWNDIDCFLINRFDSQQRTSINVFSNGIPGIVFHHRDGHPAIESILTQSGRTISPPTSFLCGASTESSVMKFAKGSYTVIQVILKPHALKAIFGINALTLKECALELNEFSAADLNKQLVNARCEKEQVTLLAEFLIAKLKQGNARDELVEESLHVIYENIGTITVRDLLEQFDISERQFERRFSQTVGLSPLSYIRVRRFNEAIRLIRNGEFNTLTEIAHALHFHDQSHFIREVKAFTGVTPKRLSQSAQELHHNRAGYSYV